MVSDPVHLVRKIYQDAAAPAEEAVEDDKDQEESKDSIIARLQTSFSNAIKGLSSTPGDPLGGSGCGLPPPPTSRTHPSGVAGRGRCCHHRAAPRAPSHHLQPVNIQMLADSLCGRRALAVPTRRAARLCPSPCTPRPSGGRGAIHLDLRQASAGPGHASFPADQRPLAVKSCPAVYHVV
ncbi:unnamed protein product [Heterosigma akashiwo]